MNKSCLLGAVCAAVFTFVTMSANAALIEVDLNATGDADITRDTDSGLEWLDLDLTFAMTLTQAATTYSGWRVATTAEYNNLFSTIFPNYDTNPLVTYSSTVLNDFDKHASQAELFFSLLADAYPSNYPTEKSLQAFYLGETTELDLLQLFWGNDPEKVVIDPHDLRGYTEEDTGSAVSLFLVRGTVVPIPPALWLFGSGLLGLVWTARKKAA